MLLIANHHLTVPNPLFIFSAATRIFQASRRLDASETGLAPQSPQESGEQVTILTFCFATLANKVLRLPKALIIQGNIFVLNVNIKEVNNS